MRIHDLDLWSHVPKPEVLRFIHVVHRLKMQNVDPELVEKTWWRGKDLRHHCNDDYGWYEPWHIGDGLHHLLEPLPVNFVQKYCNTIGRGKVKTIFNRLRESVFLNALQNAGSSKKRLKYLKPTHSVPKMPFPGRYFLNASTLPIIGMYLKTMK